VGRNFARAKYAQKTEKELRINNSLSKNIDTTENLVLKGDNLDSLKILKNHYSGQIKCIYIDPPYNTTNDEFVYPDKFDKEEAEVLGLANLSESDFARMDFSFKTKKSHNGWLAFMYPRLLLARDLLSKEGVIFISIDDNEQANLKLLCDDVFGEENFLANFLWKKKGTTSNVEGAQVSSLTDSTLCFRKSDNANIKPRITKKETRSYPNSDNEGKYRTTVIEKKDSGSYKRDTMKFEIIGHGPRAGKRWQIGEDTARILEKKNRFIWDGEKIILKIYDFEDTDTTSARPNLLFENGSTDSASSTIKELFNGIEELFDNPKPTELIKEIVSFSTSTKDIILDFFAGSGTTGHAVMELNAEDGGNRKFILCQIDEPIKEDKPAYKFCVENNLPPVISSITIERLKRAGEKIAASINPPEGDTSRNLFSEEIPPSGVRGLDVGFKVFDTVDAPKLEVKEGQILFPEISNDALSRIYNMIFTVGLDEPTQVPEKVVKDCIYKIGDHYYITNSEKITSDDYANAIKNGKVFIDGWTASLNGTLQHYKEDVKIVF
jgi:adenine-specific DNA-methyltransferase